MRLRRVLAAAAAAPPSARRSRGRRLAAAAVAVAAVVAAVAASSAALVEAGETVPAPPAPAPAPSSSTTNERTFLVSCPVAVTTEVRPLSAKSLRPLSSSPADARREVSFVAWAYGAPPVPQQGSGGGKGACEGGQKVELVVGEPLSVPGSSGASFVRTADAINVTLGGGAAGSLPLPASAAEVSACLSGSLVSITASSSSSSSSSPSDSVQLLFNKDTSCLGANALSVASIQGATSAERTADAAVAARAGVPLPKGYQPPPAPPAKAPLANPCLAQEEGYSTGLETTFFAANDGGAGGSSPAPPTKGGESLLAAVGVDAGANLDSSSFSTFKRCDCPNQRTTAAAPWPGTPSLPDAFSAASSPSGFGARLTGQVAVSRPAAGVAGEGPDLFPTASDYHLVCLQHDDAASLSIDGQPVYESAWTTTTGNSAAAGVSAGFKQYCAPLLLSPGWHDVDVRYAHASRGGASVLRFFVLDAAAVNSVDVAGTPSYEIVWEGQGKCCTGGGGGGGGDSGAAGGKALPSQQLSLAAAAPPPCAAPVDCCRFRSKGKCNNAGPAAPAALPAATQTPRPTANKNETITAKPRAVPAETTPPPTTAPPATTTPPPTPDACNPFAKVSLSAPNVDVVEAAAAADPSSDSASFFSGPRANVSISVVVSGVDLADDDDRKSFAAAELSLKGTLKTKNANNANNANNAAADASAPISLDCSLADASTKTFTCRAAGVALPDAFECSAAPLAVEVEVAATLPGGKSCPAAKAALPSLEACRPPLCRFYAVDMGFCGSEGLVTDRGRALVVMACSQPVHACGDCFKVSGPAEGRVESFSAAPGSNSTYHVALAWEKGYSGPVVLDAEQSRRSGACELSLDEPTCNGKHSTPAPVEPLAFTAKEDVPVKAVAYKILHGCAGGACSFSV